MSEKLRLEVAINVCMYLFTFLLLKKERKCMTSQDLNVFDRVPTLSPAGPMSPRFPTAPSGPFWKKSISKL